MLGYARVPEPLLMKPFKAALGTSCAILALSMLMAATVALSESEESSFEEVASQMSGQWK